jgi:hypothetical protein
MYNRIDAQRNQALGCPRDKKLDQGSYIRMEIRKYLEKSPANKRTGTHLA